MNSQRSGLRPRGQVHGRRVHVAPDVRDLRAHPDRGIGRKTQETLPGPGSRPRPSRAAGSSFCLLPNGMATSLAALARLVSSREGCLSAAQPGSKPPSIALITPSISFCFNAALRSPPRHPPIHGRPTDSLVSSVMVCSPSRRKFSKADLTCVCHDRDLARGEGAKQLDEGIDRYLRIRGQGCRIHAAMAREPLVMGSMCTYSLSFYTRRGKMV